MAKTFKRRPVIRVWERYLPDNLRRSCERNCELLHESNCNEGNVCHQDDVFSNKVSFLATQKKNFLRQYSIFSNSGKMSFGYLGNFKWTLNLDRRWNVRWKMNEIIWLLFFSRQSCAWLHLTLILHHTERRQQHITQGGALFSRLQDASPWNLVCFLWEIIGWNSTTTLIALNVMGTSKKRIWFISIILDLELKNFELKSHQLNLNFLYLLFSFLSICFQIWILLLNTKKYHGASMYLWT